MELTPRFIVNHSVNFSCKYMENFFWDNYIDCKSNNVRDILEWFFLDRRYRFLHVLCDNEKYNGRIRIYKVKHGKYLVSVEKWPKDSERETWVFQSTKSEKEVLHLCQGFFNPQKLRFATF